MKDTPPSPLSPTPYPLPPTLQEESYPPDAHESGPPLTDHGQLMLSEVGSWLARLTCLVVGPGLGDDARVVAFSKRVLKEARDMGLPLLVDGSGLNFVAQVGGCLGG